jgi:2-amino-4-hydroxy-6-hydroxymethyldihydropteridine diphosphokinase
MGMNTSDSAHILVALGGNLPFGDAPPENTLNAALKVMPEEGLFVQSVSRFFRTPCFPVGAGPDYVNAAAILQADSSIDATSVLRALHRVEQRFGRERIVRWGMRTLDLDLLAMGDSVRPDAETQARWRHLPLEEQIGRTPDRLILPHPRLQDRAFVLVPLADVAPDWVHPLTGKSVRQMLQALPREECDAMQPL